MIDVLTSESPLANTKSDPDYSVSITKYYFFIVKCPVTYFRVPTAVSVSQVEDHCIKGLIKHKGGGGECCLLHAKQALRYRITLVTNSK
jgi:hypothetical protein